jgi:hypothetical protein
MGDKWQWAIIGQLHTNRLNYDLERTGSNAQACETKHSYS